MIHATMPLRRAALHRARSRAHARPSAPALARAPAPAPALALARALAPARALALALALALLAPTGASSQVPPDLDWRTLDTEHFRVTFAPGLEPLARHAADRAELAYARLAEYLTEPPDGRIDVLLTDHTDFSNGFASRFPYNHVVLYAKPPVDHLSLSYQKGWIDLLLVHELTHVFHIDQAAWWGMAARAVFGRVPAPWPLFPAALTPSWSTEGLATFVESRFTGAGRVHGSFHEMVVRTAAVEGALPPIDRIGGHTPIWPGGHHRYIYGSRFVRELADRFGDDAAHEMVRSTARSLLPTFAAFDHVAEKAWDVSFTAAYEAWTGELEARYARVADSLRAEGLTDPERLTDSGRWAVHPRVSPDGRSVAFAGSDGRTEPATYLLDPRGGALRRLARRNQDGEDLGPAAWLPDGRLLLAQFGVVDVYRLIEDLWIVGPEGEERRLTQGARLTEPDVAPDGRRAVATRNGGGTNHLVLVDLESGSVRPLTEPSLDRYWALPRWSADGGSIAAARWSAGGQTDIVVLDTLGRVLRRITDDDAVDGAPAWSPDGRWLLFHSDRDGIFNLYAYDLHADRLLRATRVVGGAFHPEVSPDGRWLYFSGYHADGFHIERIPFTPEAWQPAGPALKSFREGYALDPDPPAGAADPSAGDPAAAASPRGAEPAAQPTDSPAAELAEPRDYSPWPTLLPRYWLPLFGDDAADGVFLGAATGGTDLVERHRYALAAGVHTGHGLFEGGFSYVWAGLGDPLLTLSASRDWDLFQQPHVDGVGPVDHYVRSDEARALLTFRRPEWRSSAAFSIGAELDFESDLVVGPPVPVRFSPGTDTSDRLAGLVGTAAFANYRTQAFSIGREDGVSLGLAARFRRDLDGEGDGYYELTPRATAYLSFPVFGFADHVLAARAAVLWRGGTGARTYAIGGATGGAESVYGLGQLGDTGSFLPVRGFLDGIRRGTRGWSLNLEHRFPLALVGRGHELWPVFLDRLYGALFLDSGDAWCDDDRVFSSTCAAGARFDPLIGAGGEVGALFRLFYGVPLHARLGLGFPLRGPDELPVFYLSFGPSF